MLDDSDLDDVLWFWPDGIGWIGAVIGIIIAIIIAVVVAGNHEECAKKFCPNGQPARLLDHQCLCVEKAQ